MSRKFLYFLFAAVLVSVALGQRGGGARSYQSMSMRQPVRVPPAQVMQARARVDSIRTERTAYVSAQRQRIQVEIQARRAVAVAARERQIEERRTRNTVEVQKKAQELRAGTAQVKERTIATNLLRSKAAATTTRQATATGQLSAKQKATAATILKVKQFKLQRMTREEQARTEEARLAAQRQATAQPSKRLLTKAPTAKATALVLPRGVAVKAPRSGVAQSGVNKPKPQPRICFVAGTLVKTEHGLRPIEDIRVGDMVWSRCDQTGDEGWQRVEQLFTTYPTELVHLSYTVEDSTDEQTLIGTANHPFWSEDRQQWVDMGHLDIAETLSLDDAYKRATVMRVEREIAPTGESFTTFNFEVAGWHTYFVAPKNSPPDTRTIWVHNQGDDLCPEGYKRLREKARIKGEAYANKLLARFGTRHNLPATQIAKYQESLKAGGNKNIPGRVQTRINLKDEGMRHVLDRHFSGKRNASSFTIKELELRTILQSDLVVKSPIKRIIASAEGDRFLRQVDIGKPIGLDKFNEFRPTSIMTVLTDSHGNLVTATPGVFDE